MDALISDEPNNVEYAIRRTWAAAGLAAALVGKGEHIHAQSILRSAIPKFDRTTKQVTGDYRIAETRIRMIALLAKAERQRDGGVSSDTQKMAEAMFQGPNAHEMRRVYLAVLEGGA